MTFSNQSHLYGDHKILGALWKKKKVKKPLLISGGIPVEKKGNCIAKSVSEVNLTLPQLYKFFVLYHSTHYACVPQP